MTKYFTLKYLIIFPIFFLLLNTLKAQKPEISSIYWHLKNTLKVETYKNGRLTKTGSGYILYAKKTSGNNFVYYSITNEHVLENSDSAVITMNDNKKIKIDFVLDSYHQLDATLFSFQSNSDSLGYFTYDSIKKRILKDSIILGDNILTISSPKGLLNSLSNGILSASREINGKNYFQFTAPISPGSSGGLVLDSKYLPIGVIVSQFTEGQNINFCIPLKIILDTIKRKYKTNNFQDITFNNYSVSQLDEHIELSFAAVTFISNLYQTNREKAYAEILNYNLNELTYWLLYTKMNYEIDHHLSKNFLSSYEFHLKKYGYNIVCSFMLVNFVTKLNSQESFDESIISTLENLDPDNEYSTKIFTDYLIGVFAYKKDNNSYAIKALDKVDKELSSENSDTTIKIFDGFCGMTVYSHLGEMYFKQNDFEKAKDAYLKLYARTTITGDKNLMATSGFWYAFTLMKLGQFNVSCDFYRRDLKPIESYLQSNMQETLRNICDR